MISGRDLAITECPELQEISYGDIEGLTYADIQKRFPKSFTAGSTSARKAFLDSETFRITIVSFVDAWNFDLKSAQKECVHLVTPDLRRIPFSMYNTLYREGADD